VAAVEDTAGTRYRYERVTEVTLPLLNDVEADCLERYLDHLAAELGDDLIEACVFGSVARGESWPAGMKIPSDLDLCVITARELTSAENDALVEATLSLYLECGRQISPAIVREGQLSESLAAAIAGDGVRVWPR
jgi:predicted nucleotidyltransferase